MSDPHAHPRRVLLLGASGLVGQQVLQQAVGRTDLRLIAVARSEVPLPTDARMAVVVALVEGWAEAIATARPAYVICALDTTIAQQGGDREAFAAVDRDLVLHAARLAREMGAQGMAVVSSVGADRNARNFYLRVKGEMEAGLEQEGFARLDVLRPGLLRGPRTGSVRPLELAGRVLAPVVNLTLTGQRRNYRAIRARDVARAALQLACEKAPGRFVHHYDDMLRLAGYWQRAKEAQR